MSDLDTLIVTFQTQLSDVMETVVKTAMCEITRLVEDGFLHEMKRRNQEVENLRVQLQWAERKLSDQEGKDRGQTVKDDMELSGDSTEKRPKDQEDGEDEKCLFKHKYVVYVFYLSTCFTGIFREWCVKREADSVAKWTGSQQEVIQKTSEAADNPTAPHSPKPQVTSQRICDLNTNPVHNIQLTDKKQCFWNSLFCVLCAV